MSDIGALRISINLDSADFTRGMRDINTRLRAVNSEFKASQAGAGRFDNSLTSLRGRADILNRTLEVHRAKVQELRRRYEESAQATGENSEQTMRLAAQYNNAVAAMRNTEDQLNLVNRRIEEQTNQWLVMQRQLHSAGESLRNVGNGMKDIGKDLSMKVTGPLVAAGTAAFKASVDFESAFAGVRKTVDATEVEFAEFEKGIRSMAKEIPAAATEIAGVAEAAGQLGIQNDALLGFTRTMIDLGEATNMSSDQAATELARLANITQMNQKNFDRLGSSIVALGNNFATTESEIVSMALRLAAQGKQVGMSEAQINALAATMSSLGIEAEAGGTAMTTVLKKIQTAVGGGGKALAGFAKAAGVSSKEFKQAWEKDAVVALDMFVKGLNNSSKEGKNLTTILSDLGIKGIRESDTLLRMAGASNLLSSAVSTSTKAWKENTALTEEAEQRYKTTASQMKILWNNVKDLGITIGGILIPIAQDMMRKIKPLVDKFAEMDEKTLKLILSIGGIVAAIGPLLVVGGTLISSLGAIMTGLGTLSGAIAVVTTGATAATPAIGGLAAVFTTLTGPIGITVAALAGIGVGIGLLVKDLKKPSIEIQRFGDDVSEATQKAVGGFLDLNDKATLALRELDLTAKEVTKETAEAVSSNFSQMADQMREALEKRSAESLEIMQNFMRESIWISQQEKDEILKNMNDKYTQQQNAISNGEKIIKEIMQKASDEKRVLTESERIQINNIQEGMVKNGINLLSQNEVEAKAIMERVKANASALTAEQAAEVVKKSVEQKEGAIKAAEEQAEQTIQEIIRQRDELGTITADQAHRMIFEAERQRDETVKKAEDMHQMVVSEAKAQAEEHVNHVNWETGEVLTKWEKFKQDTSIKWQEMKADAANWWKQTTAEVKSRAEEIKTNAYNRFEELKKQTALKWGEIKEGSALWWKLTSEVVKLKAEEMRKNAVNKFTDLKTEASRKWIEIKDGIKKPFQEARDFIDEKIKDIKGFFSNLKLEFPKIKMPKLPHFKLNGSFSLKPPSVPKLTVDWYAKGAIFTKPTIFNTPYGLKGFGEAGPEAALPLNDQVLGTIGAMIAKTMEKDNTSPSVNVVLNYQGNNVHDAYTMVDIIEEELNTRFTNRAIVNGVNP
ncbi:phage tail tape measure protein [Bacillus sp. 7504-2]|nr:phage tail tape measure protein [Bacillus sp. 7504-2]